MLSSKGILLITANVGSLFENYSILMPKWESEVTLLIEQMSPKFVALHMQEVGGKKFEDSMIYVDLFVKSLLVNPILRLYNVCHIYLDEDFTSDETFTALGNIYFANSSICSVEMYDFKANEFSEVHLQEIFSGNIEDCRNIDKSKFPKSFFPECKWSRKGFIRTRWRLDGVVFDLVNVHLFHDESNFIALNKTPSIYSEYRKNALQWILQRFEEEYQNGLAHIPYFVFGDFNFRLSLRFVIKFLVNNISPERYFSKKVQTELIKLIYRKTDFSNANNLNDSSNTSNISSPQEDGTSHLFPTSNSAVLLADIDDLSFCNTNAAAGNILLSIGKKCFDCHDKHDLLFSAVDKSFHAELRKFDIEMNGVSEYLKEMPVDFNCSYPLNEEVNEPHSYMRTRCPAWCDRVAFSHDAVNIMSTRHFSSSDLLSPCSSDDLSPLSHNGKSISAEYDVIGQHVCMGDHKPVYLFFNLLSPSNHNIPESPILTQRQRSGSGSSLQLSINGELASCGTHRDPSTWNVFDYAKFEDESELVPSFRFSYRHRSYRQKNKNQNSSLTDSAVNGLSLTFSNLAHDVVRAKAVIGAFTSGGWSTRRRRISCSSSESLSSSTSTTNMNEEQQIIGNQQTDLLCSQCEQLKTVCTCSHAGVVARVDNVALMDQVLNVVRRNCWIL